MRIKNVAMKNFKSLKNIELKLNNLTLVTGVNSSGKSTFIQSILLFKQNQEKFYSQRGSKIINLTGEYVELGNIKDILFEKVFKEDIEIEIKNNNINNSLIFSIDDSKIKNVFVLPEEKEKLLNIFYDDFQYISTDRIAPSIAYALSNEQIEQNLIGIQGEFTAHYLAENKNKDIALKDLKHLKSQTSQLLENVSMWLNEISPNIEVKAKVYEELQQVNLTYSYSYDSRYMVEDENKNKKEVIQKHSSKEYTALNVGFGITYVLPIIVAILKAKAGDLLIIENPESHLHPAGQSKVAELCAIASANGVQIIVETHSDHFLNGIRVATKKGLLTPEQSSVYYFRKDKDELETKIDEIHIDKNGGIDNYPKGFFDQFDDDLDELLGL